MKKNLFMFLAGVVTCLSVISVSGFIASPAKTENKPAVVMATPQTPKPNECDCIVYKPNVPNLAIWVENMEKSKRELINFIAEMHGYFSGPKYKKCIIIEVK